MTRNAGEDDMEAVAWDDLAAVVIRTTDLGPFVDDVFWLLQRGDGSVVVVPSESAASPSSSRPSSACPASIARR